MEVLIGIIMGWIANWASAGFRRRLGMWFMNYHISRNEPLIGYLTITFKLRWWQRLLTIFFPLKREKLKAEIRYKYHATEKWTFPEDGIWDDTQGIWTIVEEDVENKKILLFDRNKISDLPEFDVREVKLPCMLSISVRLKRYAGRKRDVIDFDDIEYGLSANSADSRN